MGIFIIRKNDRKKRKKGLTNNLNDWFSSLRSSRIEIFCTIQINDFPRKTKKWMRYIYIIRKFSRYKSLRFKYLSNNILIHIFYWKESQTLSISRRMNEFISWSSIVFQRHQMIRIPFRWFQHYLQDSEWIEHYQVISFWLTSDVNPVFSILSLEESSNSVRWY